MAVITSPSNPRIKQIRALQRRKERDATGLCVVEGIFHIGEAFASGAEIRYLCYAPDVLIGDYGRGLVQQAEAIDIPAHAVSAEVMRSVAGKDNPQGLVAVVAQHLTPLDNLTPLTNPWLVAIVAPQDPGNVGAILRTIDAVGASGLILLDGGVDAFHPTAVRASMGTVFRLPIVIASFAEFRAWARQCGYRVLGTSARGAADHRDRSAYRVPLVLLLGSEREGLSAEQLTVCDRVVQLPMRGRVTSLNLAVAAGVMLYGIYDALAEQDTTALSGDM